MPTGRYEKPDGRSESPWTVENAVCPDRAFRAVMRYRGTSVQEHTQIEGALQEVLRIMDNLLPSNRIQATNAAIPIPYNLLHCACTRMTRSGVDSAGMTDSEITKALVLYVGISPCLPLLRKDDRLTVTISSRWKARSCPTSTAGSRPARARGPTRNQHSLTSCGFSRSSTPGTSSMPRGYY